MYCGNREGDFYFHPLLSQPFLYVINIPFCVLLLKRKTLKIPKD